MKVVKMIVNDDGDAVKNNRWHYVVNHDATDRTLCTGEAFGFGESGAIFSEKINGKITCPRCISIIKEFQKIKL